MLGSVPEKSSTAAVITRRDASGVAEPPADICAFADLTLRSLRSEDFVRGVFLCEKAVWWGKSGTVVALLELWLFLAGFSQPPYQLTGLHCGIFSKEPSAAGVQWRFDTASLAPR